MFFVHWETGAKRFDIIISIHFVWLGLFAISPLGVRNYEVNQRFFKKIRAGNGKRKQNAVQNKEDAGDLVGLKIIRQSTT